MFNHRMGINKTTLRDHTKKKDAKKRGFQHRVRTTKPPLRDHPKSCPNDRDYIAEIGQTSIQMQSSKLLVYRDLHSDDDDIADNLTLNFIVFLLPQRNTAKKIFLILRLLLIVELRISNLDQEVKDPPLTLYAFLLEILRF